MLSIAAIEQEGIFRRTGKLTRQQDLKTAIYQGLPLDLDSGKFSVHDCASVLKGYLADLSEPLLTEIHFPEYCQIAGESLFYLFFFIDFFFLNINSFLQNFTPLVTVTTIPGS